MKINNGTQIENDFSELEDLCLANGWSLQETIEWDDKLAKDMLDYLSKSQFRFPEMCYALIYTAQCFMRNSSWFVYPNDYNKFCQDHDKEIIGIVNSTLGRIQQKAENFYNVISGGKE